MDKLHVVAAVILDQGNILCAKRGPDGPASNKWEFPGGKVEQAEEPEIALCREILEELNISIKITHRLDLIETKLDSKIIALEVFYATIESGSLKPSTHAEIKWLPHQELSSLDWAEPDVPFLELINLPPDNKHRL